MTWRDDAACRDTNPDLFFPGDNDTVTARHAKRICSTCPVRQQCLDAHLWEDHGIFGGTSPQERRKLRRGQQRPLKPVPCGTQYGPTAHRLRGEVPCRACRDAHNRYIEIMRELA